MVEGQRRWEKEGGEGGGRECLTWWIVTTDDFGGGRADRGGATYLDDLRYNHFFPDLHIIHMINLILLPKIIVNH
jgi:hypothetical protein